MKFEGWIMFPWNGQRRFAFTCDSRYGEIVFVPSSVHFDPFFPSCPNRTPSCSELDAGEKEWMARIRTAFSNVAFDQPSLFAPEKQATHRALDGARTMFVCVE